MRTQAKASGAAIIATEGKSKAASTTSSDNLKKVTRQQKWRQRNPAKYLAHLTVSNAQRLGLLKREPCGVCGDERTDAHHADYARPLDVEWLCRRHHSAAHKKAAR